MGWTLGGAGGGASAVPEWVSHLATRQSDETSHADDDLFGSDTSADYTAVNPTGSAAWNISRGVLSGLYSGQSAADFSVYVKSLTPVAAPVTLETSLKFFGPANDFFHYGICFTDGTAASSNAIEFSVVVDNSLNAGILRSRSGTLTNMATIEGTLQTYWLAKMMGRIYLRLVWTAANTFRIAASVDGVSWSNQLAGDLAFTLTPTNFGASVTTWAGSGEGLVAYDYFRIDASDLSV